MAASLRTALGVGVMRGSIGVETKQLTIKWVIKECELLPLTNQRIMSPTFHSDDHQLEGTLNIYSRIVNENENDILIFFLCISKKVNAQIYAEFSIPQNEITEICLPTRPIDNRQIGRLFASGIRTTYLLQLCDSDDTVTIRCKIDLKEKAIPEPTDAVKYLEELLDSGEGQMSQDVRRLCKELPRLSDVTVIVGNKQFPAHKVILAARSSVFSAMFEHKETQENRENVVKIEEMEPAVVEAMLEFFYTDEVKNLKELAYGLLAAADRYDVRCLKNMCEKFLYKTLEKDQAADILIHADLHHCCKLKEHVMGFMVDHLSDVVESESYNKMADKYPKLLKELVQSIAVQQKAKKIKLA